MNLIADKQPSTREVRMSTNDRDEDEKEDISLYLATPEDFARALERRGDAEAEKNARENIRLQDNLAELSKDLLPGEDPLFRFDERTREKIKRRAARMGKVLEFPMTEKKHAALWRAMVEKEVEKERAEIASRKAALEKPADAPPPPHFPTEMIDVEAMRAEAKVSAERSDSCFAVFRGHPNPIRAPLPLAGEGLGVRASTQTLTPRPLPQAGEGAREGGTAQLESEVKAESEAPEAPSRKANDAPKLSGLAEMRAGFTEAAAAPRAAPAPEAPPATAPAVAKPAATPWKPAGKRKLITDRMPNVQPRTTPENSAMTEETPPPLVQPTARPGDVGKPRGAVASVLFAVAGIVVVAIFVVIWQRSSGQAAREAARDPVPAETAPSAALMVTAAPKLSPSSVLSTNAASSAAPVEPTPPSAATPTATSVPRVKTVAPSKANPAPVPLPEPKPTPSQPTPPPTPAPARTTWM